MLLKTALKNIRKSLVLNLVTCLQMTAAMVVTVILISSILIRYQYYTPLKSYFRANGIYGVFPNNAEKDWDCGLDAQRWLDDAGLKAELDGEQEVLGSCNASCFSADASKLYSYGYTDNLIRAFTPELESGRWLSADNSGDLPEIVVSQNDQGWNTGDVIELIIDQGYQFRIVGVLKENAKIPTGFSNQRDPDFTQFYRTYSFRTEECPLVLMRLASLRALSEKIRCGMTAGFIVTYPDHISEDQLNRECEKLSSFGSAVTVPLRTMQKNNLRYLYRQMYDQFPIVLVLMILTAVSSICSGALTTRIRLRDYAVYYVCGLRWKQCTAINLMQSVICGLVSSAAAFLLLLGIQKTSLSEQFRIIWRPESIAGIAAVFVIYLIVSMIMPAVIIRNSTPKQILTGDRT